MNSLAKKQIFFLEKKCKILLHQYEPLLTGLASQDG
jgi:hypothetical protein